MPPHSPDEAPRPSTVRDLPRAAWISARASTPNVPLAVLSVPIYAFSILPMTLRGGLYLDESRTGTVLFARRRPILDGLVVVLVTAAAFVLWVACILLFDTMLMLLLGMLVYAALLVGAVIALVQPGGTTLSASGPETPKGDRWMVAALAQLPGTRMTAVMLARRLIEHAPPGSVLVAAAATDALLERYVRAGFTAGRARRVYRLVPPRTQRNPAM
ncbi:hypothetical protein [Pseudoclavibacter terrae]|uniref:Uncharacterized protein n=1 Tax=Pseudoclavibacter terrae TaxID=1530195 RepID=A0A7J5B4K5_9MICO|nr:hypothetical protein [Pseudoclavibacter terrae]KAB1639099.1 hypothetical protein F8O03_01770 [Pseudoclavibacter terrae]